MDGLQARHEKDLYPSCAHTLMSHLTRRLRIIYNLLNSDVSLAFSVVDNVS